MLPGYRYLAMVARVIDGDTLSVDIDLGFYTTIRTNLRLYGIDCPEMNTPEGKAAKIYTSMLLTDPIVFVDTIKADKYGNRWDAIVYRRFDGATLNDLLVNAGHAVRKTYSALPEAE